MSQIQSIKNKLAIIQAKGWQTYADNLRVKRHHFEVNPTISKDEVVAFETKHGITLSEGYRQFLLEIGNGGAGPYYGILPLEEWNFAAMILNDDEPLAEDYLAAEAFVSPLHDEEKWKAYYRQHRNQHCEAELYRGCITLCSEGCAYFALLVVSGDYRGKVCNISLDLLLPNFAANDDFLSWYERWLDETLSENRIVWFAWDAATFNLTTPLKNASTDHKPDGRN